jgi:hypothetical protein
LSKANSPGNECARAGGDFLNKAMKRINVGNLVCRFGTPQAPVGVTGGRAYTQYAYPDEQRYRRKQMMKEPHDTSAEILHPWILVDAFAVMLCRIKRHTVSLPFGPTSP